MAGDFGEGARPSGYLTGSTQGVFARCNAFIHNHPYLCGAVLYITGYLDGAGTIGSFRELWEFLGALLVLLIGAVVLWWLWHFFEAVGDKATSAFTQTMGIKDTDSPMDAMRKFGQKMYEAERKAKYDTEQFQDELRKKYPLKEDQDSGPAKHPDVIILGDPLEPPPGETIHEPRGSYGKKKF